MLRLKFFVFLVFAIVLAWFGFSHVFSKWADRAQADAEALVLQTSRAVAAGLPVSPYASLANSPLLKQTLAALPSTNITKAGQELSRRLAETFPDWSAEDIALLSEKTSEKTLWLMGQSLSEKAPEGYTKPVIQDAAHRRDMVEVGNGLKMFFLVEPPAGMESNLSLWLGGPAMRSWESNLSQELKRAPALGLGVVVSGKLVMQAGQSQQTHSLSLLNMAVSNIQPDSVGLLKNAEKPGSFISTFWGTSKQLAGDGVAARQSLGIGKAELVVVLNNQATQEALLGAEQVVFYGGLVALLVGLLVGFVVFPAGPRLVQSQEVNEATQPLPPPSPFLVADDSKVLKEASALEVASEKEEAETTEQAFALPSSPSSPPSLSLFAPPQAMEEASGSKVEELFPKMSLSAESFIPSRLSEFLQPQRADVSSLDFAAESEGAPVAAGLHGKAVQPRVDVSSLDFSAEPEEEPVAVGLHGKAVQPEELLGVDYAPHENPAAVFEATLREEAERFLGADFLPEPSSLAGEVLSTSAVEGPEVAEWRNVFAEFLHVRKQCNQETESLNFERFKTKLEASKNSLLAKHQCKTVRFLVQIKDGKAAIKAIPVRD